MTTFRKVFRIILLSFIIVLAASGAGMVGAFFPNMRERYMNKAITTEQVDKKRAEKEDNEEERKK